MLGSVFLSACGHTVKPISVDESLLSCHDEPAIPDKPVLNRAGAAYVAKLRDAGADCRSKLNGLRRQLLIMEAVSPAA